MNTHPKHCWALLAGCLVIVFAPHVVGCKGSKVVAGAPAGARPAVAEGVPAVPANKILDIDPVRWKLDRCERHGLVMTEAIVPLRWGNDRPQDFDRDYLVASV